MKALISVIQCSLPPVCSSSLPRADKHQLGKIEGYNQCKINNPQEMIGKRIYWTDDTGKSRLLLNDDGMAYYFHNASAYMGKWRFEADAKTNRHKIECTDYDQPQGYIIELFKDGQGILWGELWYVFAQRFPKLPVSKSQKHLPLKQSRA